MASGFDPDVFLAAEVEGANETKWTNVPEGVYEALIDKIDIRTPKDSVILEVMWNITDEALRATVGRDKPLVRQSIFLDVEGSTLSFGTNKNVGLGKLRDALGQNDEHRPWNPRMLEGAGPVLIQVRHRPNERDPESPFVEVSRVAKLGTNLATAA